MDRQHQAEFIAANALSLSNLIEREEFLRNACGDDAGLREAVERQVQQATAGVTDRTDSTLDSREEDRPSEADLMPVSEKPGGRIGRYKLLQQIGEGGMGVVFLAEQLEPVRRLVALKIIKLGMETKSVIARFEAERQALALMEHPNIARVFDAGATEGGRPYFVMEYLRGGKPIDEYCDLQRLSTHDRLGVFVQVCQAVQHAHHKGVIHRDLKPSNIIVGEQDGRHVPKVIDFGIAKAISQPLTDKTIFTRHGMLFGTLPYISPEQAGISGMDVDTRSDVYSLGVVLYKLLTGTTPFANGELRRLALDELCRTMREKEPEIPSARLLTLGVRSGEIAAAHGTTPRILARSLRSGLDWIVAKALEKNRSQRYVSAGALAEDVERYLSGRHPTAAPRTFWVKGGRFLRRNRKPVLVIALVGLVAAAGSALLLRAQRQSEADLWLERILNAPADQVAQHVEEARRSRDDLEKGARRILLSSLPEQRIRAAILLQAREPGLIAGVFPDLLVQSPRPLISYLRMLAAGSRELKSLALERLKRDEPDADADSSLRAAAILTWCARDEDLPERTRTRVVRALLLQESATFPDWARLFKNAADTLIPLLEGTYYQGTRFRGGSSTWRAQQANCARLLIELASSHGHDGDEVVIRLLTHASSEEIGSVLRVLTEKSRGESQRLCSALETKLHSLPAGGLAEESDCQFEARLRISRYALNHDPSELLPLEFHAQSDPRTRSWLIHAFAECGIDPVSLLQSVITTTNQGRLLGAMSALGGYGPHEFTLDAQDRLRKRLKVLHEETPFAGVRSMAEWLLREWKLEEVDADAGVPPGPARTTRNADWSVNSLGETMIQFPRDLVFQMGSPDDEPGRDPDETLHWQRIPRAFALSSKPVTFRDFETFRPGYHKGIASNDSARLLDEVDARSREGTVPVLGVSRADAMRFCNWLSRREGIPESTLCYDEPADGSEPRMRPDFLSLQGYRMPTEAEWEYACRAGSRFRRAYGESPELVGHYHWYDGNNEGRYQPVARKRPNAFGFFDMPDNGFEWCSGYYHDYPRITNPGAPALDDGGMSGERRWFPLRGCGKLAFERAIRAANRTQAMVTHEGRSLLMESFRIARTLDP